MKKKENKTNNTNITGKKMELIKLGVFAILMFIFFKFIVIIGIIPSESMQPTINVGDIVVNNALAYVGRSPERGDIVIFKSEDGDTVVKRIIGMPNDVITFVDGYVVINGMIAEEEYIDENVETNSSDTFVVPEDHYFVLGDNRENSLDSRYFVEPYIKESRIKGELLFVLRTSELLNLFKDE